EGEVDPAVAGGQNLSSAQERAQVFRALLAAGELVRITLGLDDLLIVDGHGDEDEILARSFEDCIDLPGEHAQLGEQKFSGAGAAAFREELLMNAVSDQLLQVGLESGGIEPVVLEAATEEERTCASEIPPQREEAQVRAGRHARDRVAPLP